MKKDRIIEREQAIKNGLIPDPNTPRRLEDAIDFRGICQTKCPQFEMVERDIQNSVDRLEMDEEGNLDKNKAVKAYRRSAAGNDQPLPADVRSPEALIVKKKKKHKFVFFFFFFLVFIHFYIGDTGLFD